MRKIAKKQRTLRTNRFSFEIMCKMLVTAMVCILVYERRMHFDEHVGESRSFLPHISIAPQELVYIICVILFADKCKSKFANAIVNTLKKHCRPVGLATRWRSRKDAGS